MSGTKTFGAHGLHASEPRGRGVLEWFDRQGTVGPPSEQLEQFPPVPIANLLFRPAGLNPLI
jgi:hypothetical protein